MLKKFLYTLIIIFSLSIRPTFAQEVTVVGMGENRAAALSDAARNAVEQVIGAYIDSRTLMQDLVIQLDEVYKKSQGFVNNISVIEEKQINSNTYQVKAKINVDTNPNTELMNQITLLMRLNDPRIAVVILQQGTTDHEKEAETTLNEQLMGMGLSHVVDAAHVIRLQNASLLRSIYNGQAELDGESYDNAIDHLVLGESKVRVEQSTIPDFRTGGSISTPLTAANATLSIKILKYDTGDIIGNFTTKGTGRSNNADAAIEQAINAASTEAANKVGETFRKFAAKYTKGFQLNVSAESYSLLEKLASELRSMNDVQEVYIRNYENGRGLLEVDSPKQAHEIIRTLRQKTKLRIFVENVTGSSADLAVS